MGMSLQVEEHLERLKEMRVNNICRADVYFPSLKILSGAAHTAKRRVLESGFQLQVTQSIALAAFPSNTARAEEHLGRLKEMRDNNIFKSLAALCQADISQEEASKLSKVDLPYHPRRVPVPVQPIVAITFRRLKQAHSPLPSRCQLGRSQQAVEGEILLN